MTYLASWLLRHGLASGLEDRWVVRSVDWEWMRIDNVSRRVRACLLMAVLTLIPLSAAAVGDRGADGEFARRDSFHFNLFQDVDIDEVSGLYGSRKFEQEVLSELESAYDRLGTLLSLRPERKIDVYVWDPSLFDAKYAGLFRFSAAGFYNGAIHIRGLTQVTPSLVRVLHHELVHAAFDAEAPRVALPAWMNEGIAEWFEVRAIGKRGITGQERAVLSKLAAQGHLFALADMSGRSLGGFDTNAASVAYLESYAFIDFLVRSHGEDRLVQFWSAVIRSRSLDRGARRAYRKPLADLEADFRRSLSAR
jgi:hypothetical protein